MDPSREQRLNKLNILALNFTNAIPKRVKLICETVQGDHPVTQLCWLRTKNAPDPEHINICASNPVLFLLKVTFCLWNNKYDVLFFDDLRFIPILLFFRKIRGAKLIYNRQEIPHISLASRLTERLKIPHRISAEIAVSIESFLGKKSEAIITIPVNFVEMQLLNSWNCPVLVLSNYPEKNSTRVKSPDQDSFEEFKFIYSGAIRPETGLIHYLGLMKRLNCGSYHGRVRLILVGHLWDSSEETLRDRIADHGCTEFVTYRQWVPYNELQSLYESCCAALAYADPGNTKYAKMLSGCSRKIFTYMAAGLPILAGGAFSEIVEEDGVGLRSDYADVAKLHLNAQRLLDDPSLRERLGQNGIRAIEERYNWEKQTESISALFNTVARDSMLLKDKKDV